MWTQAGTGASPGYDAVDRRRVDGAGLQEGVFGASSFEVTQRGAGANMSVDIAASTADSLGSGLAALVQGDSITAQGLYGVPPHSAVINESITSNATGNPRVDIVVLEVQDHTHDASGQNRAQVRVIAGTASSGATLANRTGAASLPSNCLLLADVLIASGASSITNSVIRDRRKWARGAFCRAVASGPYTVSGSFALIDATNLAPRVECSGAPVRVRLEAAGRGQGGIYVYLTPVIDNGSVGDGLGAVGGTPDAANCFARGTYGGSDGALGFEWVFTPSPGSHIIAPAWGSSDGRISSSAPLAWTVEEILRPNARNNATTTG